jgi:uncharacterized membrane protein (DUF373 family)
VVGGVVGVIRKFFILIREAMFAVVGVCIYAVACVALGVMGVRAMLLRGEDDAWDDAG